MKNSRYRSSLGIRHLVCGSCNACEAEMNALESPQYDLSRYGWQIVASPRHADVVTVTGPMTSAMREAAAATLEAVPAPCVVVAVGDCAMGTGVWSGAPAAGGGAGLELVAQITVAGCPPSPQDIEEALQRAADLLDRSGRKPNGENPLLR